MFKTHNLILDHAARELCRKLRKSQTEAEKIFWKHVRGRKFKGLKVIRLKNEDIEFDIKGVLKKLSIHFEDHNQDCR